MRVDKATLLIYTRRFDMPVLKWVAILLPILFMASADVSRHLILPNSPHTLVDYLLTYAGGGVAIAIFSHTIFGFITRLQRELAESNRQLWALNTIAKAAAEKLRLEELLVTSLDHILAMTKSDAGLIYLMDVERQEHSTWCSRGLSTETATLLLQAEINDDPTAQAAVNRASAFPQQPVKDSLETRSLTIDRLKSTLGVRLTSEGKINGVLIIASCAAKHYTATDSGFLQDIGSQLSMGFRNAILYEQSESHNRDLGALLTVSRAVTSSLDLDEILNKSLDTIIDATSTDAAEIWLEEKQGLAMKVHRGANREAFLEQTCFRMGQGFPGLAAQDKRPLLIHDLPSDPRFLRREVVRAGFHTFCALPLLHRGNLIGILAVAALSPNALKKSTDISLLEGIGEKLAAAIENARLHQQVQDLATQEERVRIAREMHDGMAQLLGYINAQTLAVKKMLSDERHDEALGELTKMEDVARDLYADVREGILGLRTASQRDRGLLPILTEYVERYREMSGLDTIVRVSPEIDGLHLPPAAEIQLLRIVQEALTNVRKHAKATGVHITLDRRGDEFIVEIGDNGKGFDLARHPSTGWPRFGLQTMQERAQSVGATFSIDTAIGVGTQILVRIPLSNGSAERARG